MYSDALGVYLFEQVFGEVGIETKGLGLLQAVGDGGKPVLGLVDGHTVGTFDCANLARGGQAVGQQVEYLLVETVDVLAMQSQFLL